MNSSIYITESCIAHNNPEISIPSFPDPSKAIKLNTQALRRHPPSGILPNLPFIHLVILPTMATIQDNETQINVLKEKQRRMGTFISRGWQATSDLGTITIRPDGGNEDGGDEVASGPMIPWPISSKERALLEWFRVESRVLYEIEEGENGEKTIIKVRPECLEIWGVHDCH